MLFHFCTLCRVRNWEKKEVRGKRWKVWSDWSLTWRCLKSRACWPWFPCSELYLNISVINLPDWNFEFKNGCRRNVESFGKCIREGVTSIRLNPGKYGFVMLLPVTSELLLGPSSQDMTELLECTIQAINTMLRKYHDFVRTSRLSVAIALSYDVIPLRPIRRGRSCDRWLLQGE